MQKTAEESGDLIGNEIADKITKASKNKLEEEEAKHEAEILKEDIYLQKKRLQVIDESRIV